MDAHGFPELWADHEYTTYFEKIFGDDKERQRQYMSAILAEGKAALSVGNRVLGALLTSGMCRAVFTTNFDSVVEKSVAEVSGRSFTAFHIEGSRAANSALNNEEFPIYCKLHGDFRYDSIKNLSGDLEEQNQELSACLVNAANRFGFIVAGYSGRDESVMALFRQALETSNPFPHGLYWTSLKRGAVHPAVMELISAAQRKGVTAEIVEVETFDALMLRLWRNIESKSPEMDAKVRKAHLSKVDIPLPSSGRQQPLLRLNALPILDMPTECLSLTFKQPVEWDEVKTVARASEQSLILTKSDTVWCWGKEEYARRGFAVALETVETRALPNDIRKPGNLHLKGFIEEALAYALARERPLLVRARYGSIFLIVDQHADDVGGLGSLFQLLGKTSGKVPGVFTVPTPEKPRSEQVGWAEALRISVDQKGDNLWLMIDPDIWVWPPRARSNARDFLDRRRSDRKNDKFNALLDAWLELLFDTEERNSEIAVTPFSDGNVIENPRFRISNRTAFSRRLLA
ncbi:SIR2-like protein [Chromatocurvus halotolerans]|uniref:SIR2-like protein n=2 Tax=Chromatocurvus halotolerans TaxID=1132028 RepID=A0A4R2KX31_9GAMM|nr:SIR2-like protein [Chromatocurvus halotolerans]